MMRFLALLFLLLQTYPSPGPTNAARLRPTITLDGSWHTTDNNTTSSTTVVVGPFTPTAGDGIVCRFRFNDNASFTSLADNVNAGNYTQAVLSNSGTVGSYGGIYFYSNVAGSPTTITLTYSSTYVKSSMSCAAFTPSYAGAMQQDTTAKQGQTVVTAANPTSGTAVIPSGPNELIVCNLTNAGGSGVTPTAGTNFTLFGSSTWPTFAEYWIQTAANATNCPFTQTSVSYRDDQAAFYF